MTDQEMIDLGLALDIEDPERFDAVDEDWLAGVSCNTDNPEECESCQ